MDRSGKGEGLPMTNTFSIGDFRNEFRKVLEIALTGREVICINSKLKDSEACSFLKTRLFREILEAYSFAPKIFYDETTKTHNIHLDELKLYAFADTLQEAKEQILDLAMEYSKDYLDRLELFLNVNDRKGQYPYILRISHCANREEVKQMILGDLHGNM